MLKLKPRKTAEDYLNLPADVRAELIEGELFMTPSPRPAHQLVAIRLASILEMFTRERSLGQVYSAPCDVHLPSGDIVQPDVIYISTARAGIVQDWIRGVPDLLIEIVSPENSDRDRVVKRDLYARNGVPEYWIVDPVPRTIEVFRSADGSEQRPGLFESTDLLVTDQLPGFSLAVHSIFPAV